ncbi:MAG: hypothetical protein ACREQ5_31820 [Candidatus Dormibacteria bacterium]
MGFWERAAALLRSNSAIRRRAPSSPGAGEPVVSGEQLVALQEIAERMAGMATTIKELEEQAKSLDEEAEAVARSGAASGDMAITERANVQVEVIDEMLDGIRSLRAAIDQQRAELIEAEQRLAEDGGSQ